MNIFQVILHLVILIRHIIPPSFNKSLQFHTVQHLIQLFALDPDLRLIIKNPGIIQNRFHQSFCPWILPVRVKFYPYFTDPEGYPPVCRKIVTAGKQITDKRRIRALPFCKMINFQISRKTYHLSVTPLL